MITKSEHAEALAILGRLMQELICFPIAAGGEGADLRGAIGTFMANFSEMITDQVLGTELLACFELARTAGATLHTMDEVRDLMFAEAPLYPLGVAVVNAAIIFSFVEQSQIIAGMTFTSRIEVDALMDRMTTVIEDIKLDKADSVCGDRLSKLCGPISFADPAFVRQRTPVAAHRSISHAGQLARADLIQSHLRRRLAQ